MKLNAAKTQTVHAPNVPESGTMYIKLTRLVLLSFTIMNGFSLRFVDLAAGTGTDRSIHTVELYVDE